MTKKRLAIIIWVVVGVLFFILAMSMANARTNAENTVGGTATATDLPLPIDTPVETETPTPSATTEPAPAPKPSGPATFVMPDFTNMDESEVDTWLWTHNISVSTEFVYGDDSGTDCEDAGDGIVEDQSPAAGKRVKNSVSTDLYFGVYCDY